MKISSWFGFIFLLYEYIDINKGGSHYIIGIVQGKVYHLRFSHRHKLLNIIHSLHVDVAHDLCIFRGAQLIL